MSTVLGFSVQIDGLPQVIGSMAELEDAIKKTTKAMKEADVSSPDYAATSAELAKLKAAQKALNDEQRRAVATANSASDSYNAQAAQLSRLRSAYKQMSDEERKSPIGRETLKEIQKLDAELKQLDASLGQYQRNVGNYRSAFDGIVSVLGAAGIGLGISEVVDATRDYSKALNELQAITGVSGQELQGLEDIIGNLTSISLEGGQVIMNTGTDIATAMKVAGSSRPELLSNTEALAEFTRQGIIFAKAGTLSVEDGINSLSSALAQFNLPATEATRVMNALAAGAKEGNAEIPQIVQSMEVFGAGAASANISVEESVALIETLGEKFIRGGEAGTALRNILIRIKAPESLSKTAREQLDKFGVSLETLSNNALPLSARLQELSKISGDAAAMTEVFGAENVTAAEILLNSLPRYQALTGAVTGTNEAMRQAKANAQGFAQDFENLKVFAINLATTLGGALYMSIKALVDGLKALSHFIAENKEVIIAVGISMAAYAAIVNSTQATLLSFTLAQKANALATTVAEGAQKALNIAMNAAPYALIAISVYALVKAVESLFSSYDAVNASLDAFISKGGEAVNQYANEVVASERLAATVQDETKSRDERRRAFEELQRLYPSVMANYKTEADFLANIEKAQREINAAILDGIVQKLKQQQIDRALADVAEAQLRLQQDNYGLFGVLARETDKALVATLQERLKSIADASQQFRTILQTSAAVVIEERRKQGVEEAKALSEGISSPEAKRAIDKAQKEIEQLRRKTMDMEAKPTQGVKAGVSWLSDRAQEAQKMAYLDTVTTAEWSAQQQVEIEKKKTNEIEALWDGLTASWQGNLDARDAAAEESGNRRKRTEEQLKQASFELANTLASAIFDVQAQKDAELAEKRMSDLEARQQAELDRVGQNEVAQAAINRRFAAEKEKLEKEAFQRDKQRRIQQAIVNAALAIGNALATTQPFIPNGLIAGALAAAQAGAQIAVIRNTKFARGGVIQDVFDQGGMLQGKSHAQGGIPFRVRGRGMAEAEGGEVIINKRSASIFRKELSAINSYNGYGRPLYAMGGVIGQPNFGSASPTFGSQGIDTSEMYRAIYAAALAGTKAGANEGITARERNLEREKQLQL